MGNFLGDGYHTVRNINGTSNNKCTACRSWKNHYIRDGGEWPNKCVVVGCIYSAEVGAHIQFKGIDDNKWYILPFCRPCNNRYDEDLLVPASVLMISARKCI